MGWRLLTWSDKLRICNKHFTRLLFSECVLCDVLWLLVGSQTHFLYSIVKSCVVSFLSILHQEIDVFVHLNFPSCSAVSALKLDFHFARVYLCNLKVCLAMLSLQRLILSDWFFEVSLYSLLLWVYGGVEIFSLSDCAVPLRQIFWCSTWLLWAPFPGFAARTYYLSLMFLQRLF